MAWGKTYSTSGLEFSCVALNLVQDITRISREHVLYSSTVQYSNSTKNKYRKRHTSQLLTVHLPYTTLATAITPTILLLPPLLLSLLLLLVLPLASHPCILLP